VPEFYFEQDDEVAEVVFDQVRVGVQQLLFDVRV